MTKPSLGCQSGRRRRGQPTLLPEHRDYWITLGYEVEQSPSGWLVKLSPTTTILDAGDTLTLERHGEPSDDEIKVMIAAAQARGWDSIRFFGGSERFQRRASELAIAAGYPPSAISLECNERAPKPVAASMPRHIRDRLMPPAPPSPTPEPPTPPAPTPTQETHP